MRKPRGEPVYTGSILRSATLVAKEIKPVASTSVLRRVYKLESFLVPHQLLIRV